LTKTLTQPAPDTPYPVQLSAALSFLINKPKPLRSQAHPDLQRMGDALETLATSCIVCWALGDQRYPDHMLPHCHHNAIPQREYAEFCSKLQFTEQVCWSCGCPQRVESFLPVFFFFLYTQRFKLKYTDETTGLTAPFHEGVVDKNVVCHWQHTLKPLAYLCQHQPNLSLHVSAHLRDGIRLDDPDVPFTMWLSRGEQDRGLTNILLVFRLVLESRGPPETSGVYPPGQRI
jgi:hypothetical protein